MFFKAFEPFVQFDDSVCLKNDGWAELFSNLPFIRELKNFSTSIPHLDPFLECTHIIVLGTGGSALGGRMLVCLSQNAHRHVHFLDAPDPFLLKAVKDFPSQRTGILAISKSGKTTEILKLLDWTREQFPNAPYGVITEFKESPLYQWASQNAVSLWEHPRDVGGRYSLGSWVGRIPAELAGLDRSIFQDMFLRSLRVDEKNTAFEKLWKQRCQQIIESVRLGYTQHVFWAYGERVRLLGDWWAQLWAESLGKKRLNGKPWGQTPIVVRGPQDQHSQLQLYMDGPCDKLMTFLYEPGHSIVSDFFNATSYVLEKEGIPCRYGTLNSLEDWTFCIVNFFRETLGCAWLLNIDPWNQPGVERGKIAFSKES